MKKWLIIAIFSPILLSLGGCEEYLKKPLNYISSQLNFPDTQESASSLQEPSASPAKDFSSEHTAIDELSGTLMAFDGSQILVKLENGAVYAFPVGQASLECRQGMIAGNPVVIIYEGECDLEHPETLKILKIADPVEYQEARIRTAIGKVTGLTLNTLSIRTEKGANLKFSTTGAKQYYSQGIRKGLSVYVHFQGKFYKDNEGNLNTDNVKVLNISDLETIPEPTPTPTMDPSLDERDQLKYLTGYITAVQNYTLNIRPGGAQKSINVDLRQITSRFPYGLQAGSRVTISYTGIINGTELKDARILSAVGEDLLKLPPSQQEAAVSGTLLAKTANTITISTKDGAVLVIDITKTAGAESSELQNQDFVTITFNPALSTDTAIYTAIELQVNPTV